MLQCCFKFCANSPEILCLCTEPGIMICKDHILDHVSLFSKSHKVESLFAEIPSEKKLAITTHIQAQIKKLIGFKTIFIEKAAESINCIISRMNTELKSVDENISILTKLIKETQQLEKSPKINGYDLERCLSLPTEEGISFLKTCLPAICSVETLEIKSLSFWEKSGKEDLMQNYGPSTQKVSKNLKKMTGYTAFVKEKFIELCKKKGYKPRASEFMKIIAEKWNSLSNNQKTTYIENVRRLKEKLEIQARPRALLWQNSKDTEASESESECDIIEVIGNCIS